MEMVMLGKQVVVFQEVDNGFMRVVGRGSVEAIGMGILRICRDNNKGTIELPLQGVFIERITDDPDTRPMFNL